MFQRLANVLRRSNLARQLYRILMRIDLSHSIPQISPINIKKSRHSFRRINLLIPSINDEHFFGGAATALKIFEEVLKHAGKSIKSRVILTDATPDRSGLSRLSGFYLAPNGKDTDQDRQILPAKHKHQRDIYATPGDRFISTAWWTAHNAQAMVGQQAEIYRIRRAKMGYIIQDFEPGFYGWSSHYMLADATYRSDVPTLAIVNSSILSTFFSQQGYVFEKQFVFEPRLNETLKQYIRSPRSKRKQKILIYGRPSVERNCFLLIVSALKIWIELQPDLEEWEIVSIGESHSPVKLGRGIVLKSLGKLSLEDYAALLLESAIGISFMVSPHPSYPPLEMAHFGLRTITNSYANKDLSTYHENITSLDTLTPSSIAEALVAATARHVDSAETEITRRYAFPQYLDDSPQFPFVGEFVDLLIQ